MRIKNIKVDKLRMELFKPFTVALGTIREVENLLIQIETDEGISGIGEGAPFAFVTGETMETAIPIAKMISQSLIGEDPLNIERIHGMMNRQITGNSSVKAAIDMALYDILGKKAETPLYQLLGGFGNTLETDMTIGIDQPEKMAQEAKEKAADGFKVLKVKTGINLDDDITAIHLIRRAIGDGIRIRVDANQGYTEAEAVDFIQSVKSYKVEVVEQPLPYWNLQGMANVNRKSQLPIMADESVHSCQDALKIVQHQAADIINIKLMKSAGIYEAQKINSLAEAAGLQCMVGCMLESKIAITAGASLVAAKQNITEADMDSYLYVRDPGIKGGISLEDGIITLPEKPGLGIELVL